jgi:hypothetical protein
MIKIAPLNKNNFLRWYENTTPTLANSNYTTGIHNGYFYKWRTFADQLPILVGDSLIFYTNFDSDVYFSGKTIGIVEETSCGSYSIISDPLKYDLTTSNWGSNNLKIELSIPNSNTENLTNFRLAIIDGTTVDYVSNYFTVLQATEKNINNTHLLSFYHTSNIYNFEWSGFDSVADDYYIVRVPSSKIGVEYPSEREIYKEATTGKPRVTRAINNKQISFEIYFNVEELQDAISTFTNFRYFGINGDQYIMEALETDYNKNFNLFKSVLTLKDVEFDKRVNVCNTLS